MLDEAYLLLRVSPLQCLISPIMTSSPFPSHPTGRSVFPSPAVRQSSSHGMRRLSLVPDDSAPDVDHSLGVQSRIRVFLPPKASAFTAIVQISAKARVDESLQAPESVAGIGVAIVIHPSPHRLIHRFNNLRVGARRLVKLLIRRRMLRWEDLLGWMEMHSLPLLDERRFTNSNPMKSNPSVSFVIRVLSRLIVSPIRNAIPSKA